MVNVILTLKVVKGKDLVVGRVNIIVHLSPGFFSRPDCIGTPSE